MLVVADGDGDKARATAADFAGRLWAMREETRDPSSIDAALDRALAAAEAGTAGGLADTPDNAGCGAPSDATFILAALLERGLTNVVSGVYWDPVRCGLPRGRRGRVAEPAHRRQMRATARGAGRLALRGAGDPHDARQPFGRATAKMGDVVWLRAGGIDLVINSKRTQTFHPRRLSNWASTSTRRAWWWSNRPSISTPVSPGRGRNHLRRRAGRDGASFRRDSLSKLDGRFGQKTPTPSKRPRRARQLNRRPTP